MSDQALPPSQVWGRKFVIYAALGIPRVDIGKWRLTVDGLVSAPAEYTYGGLTSLPQSSWVRSLHCVTKWSIRDVQWEGLSIRSILEPAGIDRAARWVMFHCIDGYSAPVPLEEALKDDSILAFKISGKPLSAEQGFPARPFIPSLYAWKSAKWLNRMELLPDYRDGYWETYGYHERGDVWEEERFKGHHGTPVRRQAFGTA